MRETDSYCEINWQGPMNKGDCWMHDSFFYSKQISNNEKDEFYTNGVTRALIHQESFDNDTFLPTQESPILSYSHFDNDGNESPPLECNKTLLSSKSDRTM